MSKVVDAIIEDEGAYGAWVMLRTSQRIQMYQGNIIMSKPEVKWCRAEEVITNMRMVV
jgi:hypothetical protein